jgi:hypothetical protein
MFVVSEAEAAAIRAAWQRSELHGAVEARRIFTALDNAQARDCARMIAGWTPLPERVKRMRTVRPRRRVSGAALHRIPAD